MTRKGQATRRTSVPVDYVRVDPHGNRAARRLAAKAEKAHRKGRSTAPSTGGAPLPGLRVADDG